MNRLIEFGQKVEAIGHALGFTLLCIILAGAGIVTAYYGIKNLLTRKK